MRPLADSNVTEMSSMCPSLTVSKRWESVLPDQLGISDAFLLFVAAHLKELTSQPNGVGVIVGLGVPMLHPNTFLNCLTRPTSRTTGDSSPKTPRWVEAKPVQLRWIAGRSSKRFIATEVPPVPDVISKF